MSNFWEPFLRALAPAIVTVLALMLRDTWRAYIAKVRHKPLRQVSAMDREIYELLASTRARLDADRVYIGKYSNGSFFEDGGPIMKRVRTHESLRLGVSPQLEQWSNVLTSHVPDEIELVEADGASFVVVDDLEDSTFRRMLRACGTVAIARCAIRRNGRLIGLIGADFSHREPPANLNELITLAGIIEVKMDHQH